MHKLIPAALATLLTATSAVNLAAQADTTGASYGRFTVQVVGDATQRVPTLVTRQGRGMLQVLCSGDGPVVVIGGSDALGEGTVPVQVAYDGRPADGILLARVLGSGRTALLPEAETPDLVKGARGASSMVVRATTAERKIEHTFALDGLAAGIDAVLPCARDAAAPAPAVAVTPPPADAAPPAPADTAPPVPTIAATPAPAEAAPRPRRRRDVIAQDELATSKASNALHAIEQLRAGWLRGSGSIHSGGSEVVQFYVAGQRGSAATLRELSVSAVRSIQYLEPAQASARFGPGHTEGAIVVELK